jgi:hypothetical protein
MSSDCGRRRGMQKPWQQGRSTISHSSFQQVVHLDYVSRVSLALLISMSIAMIFPSSLLALGFLAAPAVLAHPGHDIREEAAERREFLKRSPKNFRSCIPELERRGHQAAALERRQQMAHEARVKRGLTDRPLKRRDSKEYLSTDHKSTLDVSLGDYERVLFSDNSLPTPAGSYPGPLLRRR